MEAAAAAASIGNKLKVSSTDTTPGYLQDKITFAGLAVTKSIVGGGSNETLRASFGIASWPEAKAGTDNTKAMTPLRVADSIAVRALGYNQTWKLCTDSRVAGTSYQNTTGRPIMANIHGYKSGGGGYLQVSEDNSTWVTACDTTAANSGSPGTIIVPAGYYYRAVAGLVIYTWTELS